MLSRFVSPAAVGVGVRDDMKTQALGPCEARKAVMQERLQKVLARAGIASRRRAEELISQGRVQVNDRKVTELGTKVDAAHDAIRVDGALVADIVDRVYFVLYKPAGCVTTMSDPEGRATIGDWLRMVKERVFPVGRLDYDAEGALIVTNDGELAHKLMHPKFGARRTYLAKVKGSVPDSALAALKEGVRLEDGLAKPLEVAFIEKADKNTWIRLVVDEGRPHLVKRLCEAVGHPVVRLFRASYAGINVEGLMPGELRALSGLEIKRLRTGTLPDASSSLPPRRDARSSLAKPRWTPPAEKEASARPAPVKRAPEKQPAAPVRPRREAPERDLDVEFGEAPVAKRPAEGGKRVFVKKTFPAEGTTTRTYTATRTPSAPRPARPGKPRATSSDRPTRGAASKSPRAASSDRPSRGAASKAPRTSGGRPPAKGRGAPAGEKRSPRGRAGSRPRRPD